MEVVYWRLFVELKKAPSKRVLAKEAWVGPTFAQKVIAEIKRSGGIIPVEQLKVERWRKKDKRVGCLCITLDGGGLVVTVEPRFYRNMVIPPIIFWQ